MGISTASVSLVVDVDVALKNASACARGSGPGVQELRGCRAVDGGVVNGDTDGEAAAVVPLPGQERGLHREHGGATRGQRWHEDAVVAGVLGDGEGDAVAGAVMELVAVGRAGRGEPEATGERVESVEDTRQGVLEVGDDGVDVGERKRRSTGGSGSQRTS
nr:unnamed protein product [Digitaria exilis]